MLRRTVTVHLRATTGSPYSPSKPFTTTPGGQYPDAAAVDANCWREHLHVDRNGHVVIPAICFKKALTAASSMIRQRIEGKGSSEYGKHFRGGCLPLENLILPLRPEEVECQVFQMSARGTPGSGGPRVPRRYPMIYEWEGKVQFCLLSDDISEEVFEEHLKFAGAIIGVGRWRPERDGLNGRFDCLKFEWDKRLPSKSGEAIQAQATEQRAKRRGRKPKSSEAASA